MGTRQAEGRKTWGPFFSMEGGRSSAGGQVPGVPREKSVQEATREAIVIVLQKVREGKGEEDEGW